MIDTRCCKFCGVEFSKVPPHLNEGTFDDGYCSKFHRKDHEEQLIREGKLEKLSGNGFSVMKDTSVRDLNGERIWFPKDERPYYDKAAKRVFNNIQQKKQWIARS